MRYHKLIIIFALAFTLGTGVFAQQKKLLRQANKLFGGNHFTDAIPLYKEALAAGDNDEAILKLADCYRELRNFKDAEVWYKKGVDKKAAKPQDVFYYAYILKSNGKYEFAKEQFQAYSKLNPVDKKGPMSVQGCDYALKLITEKPLYEIKPMTGINSQTSDFSPVIWTGGLLYTSARGDGGATVKINTFTGEPFTEMYFARRDANKTLGQPALFAPELATDYDEGPASFDTTGGILYFTRSVPIGNNNPELMSNVKIRLKLFSAKFTDQGWKDIKELPFNGVYNTGHPFITNNGKKLIFISDMPGGKGGTDLYSADKIGEGWGAPKNLGPDVNTEGHEMFPQIAPDGALYFSSDMLPGLGGLDVFRAEDAGGKFTNPTNLKSSLNSSWDDFGIMFDSSGKDGYVCSNRPGGMGSDDIYSIAKLPDDTIPSQNPTDTSANANNNNNNNGNNNNSNNAMQMRINGKVFELTVKPLPSGEMDKQRGSALQNSKVTLNSGDKTVGSATTGANGDYGIDEKKPGAYKLTASKSGYFTQQIDLNIAEGTGMPSNETFNFELEKIIKDQRHANMPNVYFDFDKSDLRDETKTKLDMVARIMLQNPGITLELGGHACPKGTDNYNLSLSQRRSKAVEAYMKEKGVPVKQMFTKGYGESTLAIPDPKSEAEYEANRRAEFVVRQIDEAANAMATTTKKAFESQSKVAQTNATTFFRGVEINNTPTTAVAFHQIKKGDTLFAIAKAYNTTVDELIRLNNLDGNRIKEGKKLKIRD